jgi:hypothetical protein
MSDIQIYYTAPTNVLTSLKRQNYEIDSIVRLGPKTIDELKAIIKTSEKFCRDEESITANHLANSLSSNVILYAIRNNEVIGVLIFMFNQKGNGDKFINFDGICSPTIFGGLGVGHELIDTLIRIGRFNGVKYINLECKGSVMQYYKNRFGFVISEKKTIYDSDEDSDDEGEPYYYMTLDLTTASGGKRKRKIKTKRNKKSSKRKQTRRKLRKYH